MTILLLLIISVSSTFSTGLRMTSFGRWRSKVALSCGTRSGAWLLYCFWLAKVLNLLMCVAMLLQMFGFKSYSVLFFKLLKNLKSITHGFKFRYLMCNLNPWNLFFYIWYDGTRRCLDHACGSYHWWWDVISEMQYVVDLDLYYFKFRSLILNLWSLIYIFA